MGDRMEKKWREEGLKKGLSKEDIILLEIAVCTALTDRGEMPPQCEELANDQEWVWGEEEWEEEEED